jgi:hypothetical protein
MATAALFIALGGGSFAAIHAAIGSGDLLRGCVSKRTGALRVLSGQQMCHRGELPVSWNEKGRPGTQGVPGPKGDAGPKGQAGPKGDTGTQGATGPGGAAGGDLSGTYPDPTVTTIGGRTPITDATTASGDLYGTFPSVFLLPGSVTAGDLSEIAAVCSVSDVNGTLSNPVNEFCTGQTATGSSSHPKTGVYCLDLPFYPTGGSVSIDAGATGFPLAFMSVDPDTRDASCDPTDNVLVTTYLNGTATNERWYGFFH